MPAFTIPTDESGFPQDRWPSGARLYRRHSRFGPPERRKLDRNVRTRLFYLAIVLDRRTRQKGMHGGILKRTGVEVLRVLLFVFHNLKTGECFPSHEALAEAARCCVETVRKAIRALEAAGLVETVRRKVVETYTSRRHRMRYDIARQDSNSYVFNNPHCDRHGEGGLALPLLRPKEADTKFPPQTNQPDKNNLSPELAATLERFRRTIEAAERSA